MSKMRGYFGVGAEGLSKPLNMGAIMRTAHAFGASFVFTIAAEYKIRDVYHSDTSKTDHHVPWYDWANLDAMALPRRCQIVGVELDDRAVDLPSFKHPISAAYVFGRERGSLSPAMIERCDHLVKIPTRFCVNVSVACALTLYDRLIALGDHTPRPIIPGAHAPKDKLPG